MESSHGLTDGEIFRIARILSRDSDAVRRKDEIYGQLGLLDAELEDLKVQVQNERSGSFGFFSRTLQKYRSMKGSKGTVDSLIRHFNELELTSVVEVIQKNQDGQETTTTGIWFDVEYPTDSFTGREQELSELHALLTRSTEKPTVINQISTVSGLGGIGKSELARKYAWDYYDHYNENVIWIDAETQGSFRNSVTKFLQLHFQISEEESKKKKDDELVKLVYDGFTSQKCLIIFDNVEEFEVMKLLPKSLNSPKAQIPTVLITSRISDWGLAVQVLHLDVLTKEAAVYFVKANVTNAKEEEEAVVELVETLQCLPLTLQQAVAYIRNELKLNLSPITTYLELFKRNEKDILSYTGEQQLSLNEKTTLGTWKMTLMGIRKRKFGELAIRIMEIISWFDAEEIPIRLFKDLTLARPDAKWYTKILNIIRKTESEMKDIEAERRVEAAIILLKRYSMVSGSGGVINVHRLVQYVVRLEIHQKLKILSEALELNNNYRHYLPLTHGLSLWRHALKFEDIIKRYSSFPSTLYFMEHETVLKLARDSKGRMERILGCMHEDVLSVKRLEARALFRLKFYSESLELSQELYSNCKVAVGSRHPFTNDVFFLVVKNLKKLGRHCEELKMYDERLEILLKELGPQCFQTFETRRMKGLALKRLGRYDEALEVLQKDKEMNSDEIAEILEEKGNWREAVEQYKIYIKSTEPRWLYQESCTRAEAAIKRCEEKLIENH